MLGLRGHYKRFRVQHFELEIHQVGFNV